MSLRPFSHAVLAACLALAAASPAHAAGKRVEAERLFQAMDMQASLDAAINMSLESEIKANPALEPYRGVMLEFFRKYMSYESLKPEFIKVYEDAFTEEELAQIRAFQESPVGKKSMRLMPELMAAGAKVGQERVQAHIGELKAMIDAADKARGK